MKGGNGGRAEGVMGAVKYDSSHAWRSVKCVVSDVIAPLMKQHIPHGHLELLDHIQHFHTIDS